MDIKININCDNDAFGDLEYRDCEIEISRILSELAEKISNRNIQDMPESIYDINGNNVGEFQVIK